MRSQINSGQVRDYQANGFLAIEDFLNARELQSWRDVTEQAVAQRLCERDGFTNQSNPDDYYANVFTQCVRLSDTHEGMAKLMLDSRLGETAATLAGVDGIRIWHDQALIKPPFGNPTA